MKETLFDIKSESMLDKKVVLSVSQLSSSLKSEIEDKFSGIKVKGEISGIKRHSSGHVYFALKDDNSVIDAICWRGTVSKHQLKLEEGLEIIASGRVTTYPGRSKYQIIVENFMPTGQGALLKLLEERKERLRCAGYFDASNKKQLPKFPKKIGVITSETGAVIKDILHRLEERYPCDVLLWPAAVQGVGCAEKISEAIVGMNELDPSIRPDVLIVARGGGSLEDLWAFNEEIIIEAVHHSEIPIISAIGHETDTTLIDYVSDKRAPTPTAAAEIATPVNSDLLYEVSGLHSRLHRSAVQMLREYIEKYKSFARFVKHPNFLIEEKEQRLDEWTDRLDSAFKSITESNGRNLENLSKRLRFPSHKIDAGINLLENLNSRITRSIEQILSAKIENFNNFSHRLLQSSYDKTLEKGFCYMSVDNVAISSSKNVPFDKKMNIVFHDGEVVVKRD